MPSQDRAVINRGRSARSWHQHHQRFFGRKLADDIVAEHGHADAVICANVMCHIPDLPGVAAGIQRLLKPDGVFIFEDPYLGDMIAKTSYDQIYDEHVFIFSVNSVARAFAMHGLELIDVMPQTTHGGSMRYMLAPKGSRVVSAAVGVLLRRARKDLIRALLVAVQAKLRTLRGFMMQMLGFVGRKTGCRLWGDLENTTVTNYCGITPDMCSFGRRRSTGKLSPAHIR